MRTTQNPALPVPCQRLSNPPRALELLPLLKPIRAVCCPQVSSKVMMPHTSSCQYLRVAAHGGARARRCPKHCAQRSGSGLQLCWRSAEVHLTRGVEAIDDRKLRAHAASTRSTRGIPPPSRVPTSQAESRGDVVAPHAWSSSPDCTTLWSVRRECAPGQHGGARTREG